MTPHLPQEHLAPGLEAAQGGKWAPFGQGSETWHCGPLVLYLCCGDFVALGPPHSLFL